MSTNTQAAEGEASPEVDVGPIPQQLSSHEQLAAPGESRFAYNRPQGQKLRRQKTSTRMNRNTRRFGADSFNAMNGSQQAVYGNSTVGKIKAFKHSCFYRISITYEQFFERIGENVGTRPNMFLGATFVCLLLLSLGLLNAQIYTEPYQQWDEWEGDLWSTGVFARKLFAGEWVNDQAKYQVLKERDPTSEGVVIIQASTADGSNLLNKASLDDYLALEEEVLASEFEYTVSDVTTTWKVNDMCFHMAPNLDYEYNATLPCLMTSPTSCFYDANYRVNRTSLEEYQDLYGTNTDDSENEEYPDLINVVFPYMPKTTWDSKVEWGVGDDTTERLTSGVYKCMLFSDTPVISGFVTFGGMEIYEDVTDDDVNNNIDNYAFLLNLGPFYEQIDFTQIFPVAPISMSAGVNGDGENTWSFKDADGRTYEDVTSSMLHGKWVKKVSSFRSVVLLAQTYEIARRLQVMYTTEVGLNLDLTAAENSNIDRDVYCDFVVDDPNTPEWDYFGKFDCPDIKEWVFTAAGDIREGWSKEFSNVAQNVDSRFDTSWLTPTDVADAVNAGSSELIISIICAACFLFVFLVIYQCRADCIRSRMHPAVISVVFALLSVIASLGVTATMMGALTSGALFTIPFLGLALGIQQIIMVNSVFDQIGGNLDSAKLAGIAAKKTGPPCTLIVIVNTFLFFLAPMTITAFELQTVCGCLGLQQLISWFVLWFGILPILVMDAERQKSRHFDTACFRCCHACCGFEASLGERDEEMRKKETAELATVSSTDNPDQKDGAVTKALQVIAGSYMEDLEYENILVYPDGIIEFPDSPWDNEEAARHRVVIDAGDISWEFQEYADLSGQWESMRGSRALVWFDDDGRQVKRWVKQGSSSKLRYTRKLMNLLTNPICGVAMIVIAITLTIVGGILSTDIEVGLDMTDYIPQKTNVYDATVKTFEYFQVISGVVGSGHDGNGGLLRTDWGEEFPLLYDFHKNVLDSEYTARSVNWVYDYNVWAGYLTWEPLPNPNPSGNEYITDLPRPHKPIWQHFEGSYPELNECLAGDMALCDVSASATPTDCLSNSNCQLMAAYRIGNVDEFAECAADQAPDYDECCISTISGLTDTTCHGILNCAAYNFDSNVCLNADYQVNGAGVENVFSGKTGYAYDVPGWDFNADADFDIDDYSGLTLLAASSLPSLSMQECFQACLDEATCTGVGMNRTEMFNPAGVGSCEVFTTSWVQNAFTLVDPATNESPTNHIFYQRVCGSFTTEDTCNQFDSLDCLWSSGVCNENGALTCDMWNNNETTCKYYAEQGSSCIWDAGDGTDGSSACLDPRSCFSSSRIVVQGACFDEWFSNFTNSPLQKMFTPEIFFAEPGDDTNPYSYMSTFMVTSGYTLKTLTASAILDAIDHMNTIISKDEYDNIGFFWHSNFLAIYTQLVNIEENFSAYFTVAFIVVLITSLFIILDPRAALIFCICHVMTFIEVYGFASLNGLELNGAMFTNMIIAVAMSVGFGSHLNRQFMLARGPEGKDYNRVRLETALLEILSPTIAGTICIFLSVVYLAFGAFKYMQKYYFLLITLVVIFGYFNNIFLQSVLLLHFGPASYGHIERKMVAAMNKQIEMSGKDEQEVDQNLRE